jgi:hypothetical protein
VSEVIRSPTESRSIGQPGVLTRVHDEYNPDGEAVIAAPDERDAVARESLDDLVDLRPLKGVARHLPTVDPVRLLIEGEPDRLPRVILAAKADSWVLLLLRGG